MIFVGSDHAGFGLKGALIRELEQLGWKVHDLGAPTDEPVDYPGVAHAVAREILGNPGSRGILVCGTGIGMAIAANRHPGIRAALCNNREFARLARAHNDANILVLPGRHISHKEALESLEIFLATPFEGGRHAGRVAAIDPAPAGVR